MCRIAEAVDFLGDNLELQGVGGLPKVGKNLLIDRVVTAEGSEVDAIGR